MMSRSLLLLALLMTPAYARYDGPPNPDPRIQKWFQELKQPDHPRMSCCGTADSFEADNYESHGDQYIAIITDGRGIWPNGTRVEVPNNKINNTDPNPTIHGYLFLKAGTLEVFCYAPPASG